MVWERAGTGEKGKVETKRECSGNCEQSPETCKFYPYWRKKSECVLPALWGTNLEVFSISYVKS